MTLDVGTGAGTGLSTDVYVALIGHVVFLAVFVGWVVVVNRRERREERATNQQEGADQT